MFKVCICSVQVQPLQPSYTFSCGWLTLWMWSSGVTRANCISTLVAQSYVDNKMKLRSQLCECESVPLYSLVKTRSQVRHQMSKDLEDLKKKRTETLKYMKGNYSGQKRE